LHPTEEFFPMSVLVRHQISGLTREKYDEVSRQMEESGAWPPDGIDIHVCFGSDDDLRVSEIWDSEEQLRAFTERLFPVLSEVGVERAGEPELFEIQELQKR
jgi:hypothetical protein